MLANRLWMNRQPDCEGRTVIGALCPIYRTRVVQSLKRKAKRLGFALVEAVEKQPKIETT